MLVSDVIYTAYRIAGILADAGITENPEELNDGFNALNAMLDAWNTQRLFCYTIIRYLFNFVTNQQSYQIGPGAADWDFPRPVRIETASCIITNTPALPVEQILTPLTYEGFQRITVKQVQSPIPFSYYYDQQSPIGNVYFYPVPNNLQQANQCALYVWQLIPAFQSTNAVVQFPPAYLRAIQYNLAIELADRFPLRQKLRPGVEMKAMQAIREIKSLNTPIEDMRVDPAAAAGGGNSIYNYLSDSPLSR
jgi:hypothetical protein